jgi:hypothetical protein
MRLSALNMMEKQALNLSVALLQRLRWRARTEEELGRFQELDGLRPSSCP